GTTNRLLPAARWRRSTTTTGCRKKKGDTQIRTGDGGFADPCLTTWLCRRYRAGEISRTVAADLACCCIALCLMAHRPQHLLPHWALQQRTFSSVLRSLRHLWLHDPVRRPQAQRRRMAARRQHHL